MHFGFGPYRGCPAVRVHACKGGGEGHHAEFLRWMLRRDFPLETKATVEMLLKAVPPTPAALPAMPATAPTPAVAPLPAAPPDAAATADASGRPPGPVA